LLQGNVVACHTAFDRVALLRACEKNHLAQCECRWLDSAMVVRRAWPDFAQSGYGLTNVAAHFGIEYQAHDALEDGRCAGEILLRAIAETGLSIDQWLERVKRPINLSVQQPHHSPATHSPDSGLEQTASPTTRHGNTPITRHGNTEGPLYGEVLVFTGALSLPRHQAADAASAAGCEVATSITKHTTLLVIGDQDVRKLAGYEKSSKQRKAEEMINEGQQIRIISESDFQRIVAPQSN
jgi:DNA polymerase III subunit epsilon